MGSKLARIFHGPDGFIGKAFEGAAVVNLLQALDNAANGCLRERPKGDLFYFSLNVIPRKLYPDDLASISVQVSNIP